MKREEDFAELLGRYRVRAGLTQQALANAIGVHRNSIVNWENRTKPPESRGKVLRLTDELSLAKEERKAFLQAAGFLTKEWPTEVWIVPQLPDPFFTGRGEILESLHDLLVPGNTTAFTQAITGLGGIGKTHTAIEYAHRFHRQYEAVIWLPADSWENLVSGCLTVASELGLQEQQEAERIVVEVQHWLRTHRNWLLILDDVEQPETILPRFIPTRHQGCILITTRVQQVEPLAQSQTLPLMPEQEGVLFLLRRTTRIAAKAGLEKTSVEQYEEARQLWDLLDGLPLALDQAGAYILETGCSFSSYQEQYKQQREALLTFRGRRILGHKASVTTTFSLAFERIEALNPVAADILRACSLLYGEAIPEELFQAGAEHLSLRLATESARWDLALAVLQDYSLVQRNPEAKTLTIHRLVQAVLQDILSDGEFLDWIVRAIAALESVFPQVEFRTWSQCERYLPHVLACASEIEKRDLSLLHYALPVFYRAGLYLLARGRYSDAEPLCKRTLSAHELLLRPEDPHLAEPLTILAFLYKQQGKYEQAEPLYQRALAIREQRLGIEHPSVAASLNNLAELYQIQEKHEQAEPLYQRALAIQERQLEAEHTDIAVCLNNLASLYLAQKKYEQAEPLFQQALAIRERQLGAEHPDTARCLCYLAFIYTEQEKYEQAELVYKRAFTIQQRAFGVEHPETTDTLNHLAMLYIEQGKGKQVEPLLQEAFTTQKQMQGAQHLDVAKRLSSLASLYYHRTRYEQAEPLLQRALAIQEQLLGAQHLDVASNLRSLASLYQAQKKYEQAEPLLQRALAIQEQLLGAQHFHTVSTLNDLALFYKIQRKYEQAEPLFARALAIEEEPLGNEHLRMSAVIRANLAFMYTKQGKYEQAELLLQHALILLQQTFGVEHPVTTDTLNYLAELYRVQGKDKQVEILYLDVLATSLDNQADQYFNQGKYEQAESLYKRVLTIRKQHLGAEHSDIVNSLDSLAFLYYTQGKFEQAEPLWKQVLALREQQLGAEHPDTASSLNSLAALYNDQRKYEQAEPLYIRALAIQEKLEPGHRATVATLNNLALLYRDQGRYEQAMSLYQRALATLEQLGTKLPHIIATLDTHTILLVATILDNLALLYDDIGAYEEAEQLYQRALSIYEQRLGAEHPDSVIALNNLALFYQERGMREQAKRLYRRLLSIREEILGHLHPKTVQTRKSYATLLQEIG